MRVSVYITRVLLENDEDDEVLSRDDVLRMGEPDIFSVKTTQCPEWQSASALAAEYIQSMLGKRVGVLSVTGYTGNDSEEFHTDKSKPFIVRIIGGDANWNGDFLDVSLDVYCDDDRLAHVRSMWIDGDSFESA